MPRLRTLLTPLLLLCAGGIAEAQQVPGAPVTDWDRVRADYTANTLRDYSSVISDWDSNVRSGDAKAAAALYAEGGTLLVSGAEAMLGRDAIRAYLETRPFVEVRTGLRDFAASDHLAFATGPAVFTYRDPATGAVRTINGHHVTVLTREARRWRIRSQVWKFEPPPPA